MAKLEIDTDNLKATAEEMKKIAADYKKLIEEMYKKINNIPNTNMWTSDDDKGSAIQFVEKVMKDKDKTLDVGNNLSKLGEEIIVYSDSLKSISDNII